MKIKISKMGILELERAGKFRVSHCPFAVNIDEEKKSYDRLCGDWCPLFSEPEYRPFNYSDSVLIKICKAEWMEKLSDFTDERK